MFRNDAERENDDMGGNKEQSLQIHSRHKVAIHTPSHAIASTTSINLRGRIAKKGSIRAKCRRRQGLGRVRGW